MDRIAIMSTFVQVVDCGSFSGAAKRVALSPAMATTHVQSLERLHGIRLLNRTTRKVSLTEEGGAFYRCCRQILAGIAEAERLASSLQSAPRGRLRINTDVALARVVAPLIADYADAYPDVSVELIMTDRIVDMVEGQYDLAIFAGPLSDSSLIRRSLGVGRWVLCAAPGYIARAGAPKNPADLARHNCLSLAASTFADRWCFTHDGVEREISVAGNLRSNSIEALRAAALAGHGVCLLPLLSVSDDLASGRLVRLLPDHAVADAPIQAVYPSGRHVSVKLRTFLDFVTKRLREVASQPPKDDAGQVESEPVDLRSLAQPRPSSPPLPAGISRASGGVSRLPDWAGPDATDLDSGPRHPPATVIPLRPAKSPSIAGDAVR
jgi:DNA-binding transcriptional LysR family regulator